MWRGKDECDFGVFLFFVLLVSHCWSINNEKGIALACVFSSVLNKVIRFIDSNKYEVFFNIGPC